jgi:hypothetical protein
VKIRSVPSVPKRVPLRDVLPGTCCHQPHIGRMMLRTTNTLGNTIQCCAVNTGDVYWLSLDAPVIPVDAEVVITEGDVK